MIQLTLTLKISTTQVVKMSVTVNNSPIQGFIHPDDCAPPAYVSFLFPCTLVPRKWLSWVFYCLKNKEMIDFLGIANINPLSPNIHIQILQTDLYTFP